MSDANALLKRIKDEDIEYVDLRFTDPRSKWHHLSMHKDVVDEDMFVDGVMFDGSSIAGWKAINESDMVLMPDVSTAVLDPFSASKQLIIICDVLEPGSHEAYGRDPRGTAKSALNYLNSTGIGDAAYFGPEPEFFMFDNVQMDVSYNQAFYRFDDVESPHMAGSSIEGGNMGHRPRIKGGYFPAMPVDSGHDIRAEMLGTLRAMGVPIEKHHHEVATSQHELGMKFGTLVTAADAVQLYKYACFNVAHAYGKTVTFMPKPVAMDNGSGMHVHQSIWKGGKPLFAGNGYADLSDECLYYIGGIIKHAKAINAFTNATTNSYKRLVPGYEAPVLLAYSARNRSASCRIPYSPSPKGKRVEVRFPDPASNPYLGFAAMMMAGLDGIQNKIHPGEAMDKDLYHLPPEELAAVPTVCGSLREACNALDADRDFLKKGGVFNDDQINGYLELKAEEYMAWETAPHPIEYMMYYSA